MLNKNLKIIKALANQKRLEILELLKNRPGLSLTEISLKIKLHYKSTSKHLSQLNLAELIVIDKNGRYLNTNLTRKTERLLKYINDL